MFFFFTDENTKQIENVDMTFKRSNFDYYYEQLELSNISIVGLRRIGKTTIAMQLAKQYSQNHNISSKQILLLNMKAFTQIDESKLQYDIIESLRHVKLFIIDEIQELSNWTNFVQVISDFRKDAKFIFTGSNATSLTKNLLVGRSKIFYLNPLSFKEFSVSWKSNDFERYLKFGSYPFNGQEVSMEQYYPPLVNDIIIEKVISDDIDEKIDKNKFNRFFRSILNHNDKSMIFLFNNYKPLNKNDLGAIIENLIFNTLYSKYNKQIGFSTIYYYRDKKQNEIDFIIPSKKLLIESKYTDDKTVIYEAIDKYNNNLENKFNEYRKLLISKSIKMNYGNWEVIPLLDFLELF